MPERHRAEYHREHAAHDHRAEHAAPAPLVRDPADARARDGRKTVVSYNSTTFYDRDRKLQGVFAAARDVTERKAAQEKQGVTNSLLKLFARKTLRKTYLDSTVKIIRNWSGCEFGPLGGIPMPPRIQEFTSLFSLLNRKLDCGVE